MSGLWHGWPSGARGRHRLACPNRKGCQHGLVRLKTDIREFPGGTPGAPERDEGHEGDVLVAIDGVAAGGNDGGPVHVRVEHYAQVCLHPPAVQ